MKLTSEALRELYQKETARSARGDRECPSEEMLTSAASGDLSREQREQVADHLAICSSCAKEYRAIRSLKPWAQTEPAFSGRFGESRLFTFYIPAALAALFLILALLLGVWLVSQRRENERLVAQVSEKESATAEANRRAEQAEAARRVAQEELNRRAGEEKPSQRTPETETPKGSSQTRNRLDQPLANVPIFELEPGGSTRSGGGDAVTLEAPSYTRLITLILHVNGPLSPDAYTLEVLDRTGQSIWVSRGLRRNSYNNFTVALPRRTFPAGDYRLRLYSLRDGRREKVEEYAIHLQYR